MSTDTPNDEFFPDQWALSKIDAPTAWGVSKGGGIKIAVIDTGFVTNHSDLSAHMTTGWNCNGTNDVSALSSHGTRVAGIAAAVTNNGPGSGSGIAGVGWNSLIIPLRYDTIVEGLGSCPDPLSYESFLIDKAIAEGAHVINMSYSYGTHPIPAVCANMQKAWDAGILPVASAGNASSSSPEDPAACARVMAIGATNPNDSKASYSNFGSWLTLSAPGGECALDNDPGRVPSSGVNSSPLVPR